MACHSRGGRDLPLRTEGDSVVVKKDTVAVAQVVPGEGASGVTDTAAYMKLLEELSVGLLKRHTGVQFDTTVLLFEQEIPVHVYRDRISTGGANAVVEVHDNDTEPVLFFTRKGGNWTLKQTIFPFGKLEDQALRFEDYNFDGRTDLGIVWYYSSGRCNCSGSGCLQVFLWNRRLDSLAEVPEISHYLEFAIVPKEKALYLGEHCNGFYGRFGWQGDSLRKLEEYVFPEQADTAQNPFLMEHNIYRNGKKTTLSRTPDGELPKRWQAVFAL